MVEEGNQIAQKKRTQQLTFLSILSFIGGGMSIISNFVIYVLYDQIKLYFKDITDQNFLGTEIDMSFFTSINPNFFLWQIILFSISVYGVFLMWKLKSYGFHIYSVSQILLLIIPEIYVPSLPFPLFEILLTIVFILLYYKNLKEIEKG